MHIKYSLFSYSTAIHTLSEINIKTVINASLITMGNYIITKI